MPRIAGMPVQLDGTYGLCRTGSAASPETCWVDPGGRRFPAVLVRTPCRWQRSQQWYRQSPQADRLADTTAIPPLSRLFMVGMGMLCRHVGVRDHSNDQHSICY
jgi:hypothetical protein